jgi:hypothetical protein
MQPIRTPEEVVAQAILAAADLIREGLDNLTSELALQRGNGPFAVEIPEERKTGMRGVVLTPDPNCPYCDGRGAWTDRNGVRIACQCPKDLGWPANEDSDTAAYGDAHYGGAD